MHGLRKVCVAVVIVAAVGASAQTQSDSRVRLAPPGQKFAANPAEKGATYYGLEGQAVRVTARFGDAVAVAERSFDGDMSTTLTNAAGSELGRLTFDRIDGVNDVLQYTQAEKSIRAFVGSSVHPTLDWAIRQTYHLWADHIDPDTATLEWRDNLIRRRGAPNRSADAGMSELRAEWTNGLAATTTAKAVDQPTFLRGRALRGKVLVTRLTRDGAPAGYMNYFAEAGVLAWDLPGLTKGFIAPDHLSQYGGWPFTPDLAWMNVQATAFHHFKTLIQKNGFVARRTPGLTDRVLDFLMPALSADEPGCDDLHWLDGSVFRYCCDVHDLCYAKNGCTSRSWWKIWSSWTCTYCNAWAVDCFLSGGVDWGGWGIAK